MKGKLYIVATPIGNLQEISNRTFKILQDVDLIACEDTRQTLKLLNHLDLKKKMESYHRHNEEIKTQKIIAYLNEGKNIALVSDAGMPGICDPGHVLIKEAIKEQIDVIPISRPSSFVNALVGSGIDTSEFTFLGFLPLNKKNRKEKLNEIKDSNKTIILFEAPHKIKQTIKDLKEILEPQRKICLARELTKIHEQFIRSTIENIENEIEDIKGEIVVIIEKSNIVKKDENLDLSDDELYDKFIDEGLSKKDVIKKIASIRNVNKNEIYQKFINR